MTEDEHAAAEVAARGKRPPPTFLCGMEVCPRTHTTSARARHAFSSPLAAIYKQRARSR